MPSKGLATKSIMGEAIRRVILSEKTEEPGAKARDRAGHDVEVVRTRGRKSNGPRYDVFFFIPAGTEISADIPEDSGKDETGWFRSSMRISLPPSATAMEDQDLDAAKQKDWWDEVERARFLNALLRNTATGTSPDRSISPRFLPSGKRSVLQDLTRCSWSGEIFGTQPLRPGTGSLGDVLFSGAWAMAVDVRNGGEALFWVPGSGKWRPLNALAPEERMEVEKYFGQPLLSRP